MARVAGVGEAWGHVGVGVAEGDFHGCGVVVWRVAYGVACGVWRVWCVAAVWNVVLVQAGLCRLVWLCASKVERRGKVSSPGWCRWVCAGAWQCTLCTLCCELFWLSWRKPGVLLLSITHAAATCASVAQCIAS